MRKIIAVTITKLFIIIGKLVGKKGSSTPGKFALFIYPGILKYLASQIRGKIIVVCGTNGKTTTNNMLCSLLESEGKKVVCNHVGANMLEGVVTAFAGSTNFWEGWMPTMPASRLTKFRPHRFLSIFFPII